MKFTKIVLIFIAFLVCPSALFASNTLRGKVTDIHGISLPGAIVEIVDLKTGAAADTGGNYIIENLPNGTFSVEVHFLGYATMTTIINLVGDEIKNFKLSENIIEKNEVVITGASLATGERRNITPIQSISLRQMHEGPSTNIIDAIASLPGVSAVTTGPAISKPVIRGLGSNRIITLNNGVRQEGQQWGDEHGIEIDDYNVTRVEVLKGPASLAYGADGLAGVVNIISSPDVPEGKIQGNITSNFQSNSGLMAGHANITGKVKGFTWSGYVTGKQSHDYHNKYDGYVYNTRFNNKDYGVSLGVNRKWGSSKISITSFDQLLGLPEGERDSATGQFVKDIDGPVIVTSDDNYSYAMNVPYQHIKHEKWVWDNSIYLKNGNRIGATVGYQRNTRQEFADATRPDTPGIWLQLQTLTYDLKYIFSRKHDWHISTGLNGMSQWNMNLGDEFLVPDYRLFDGGAYMIAKRDWEKWTVSGGIRGDIRVLSTYMKVENAVIAPNTSIQYLAFYPLSGFFTNGSGSIGAAYNKNDNSTFKLNFSSGFRTPNIAELAATGVHEGTLRYEYGNASLKPEQSLQADLGYSYRSEHLMINASLFDNFISKFIYIRKMLGSDGTDSIPTFQNPDGFAGFIQAQGNANLYGGELNIDYHPHPFDWLHIENTVSYVRGRFINKVENTYNLPYMPPARWLSDVRIQKRALSKRIRNAYAKAGVDVNFAQNNVFDAYTTETTNKGYTLVNCGMGADIVDRNRMTRCTITIAVSNLFDVAYQNSLSRLRYSPVNNVTGRMGMFNQGRNVSAMVSVPLSFK